MKQSRVFLYLFILQLRSKRKAWLSLPAPGRELERGELIKTQGNTVKMLNAKCPQGVTRPRGHHPSASAPTLTAGPRHQGLLSGEPQIFIKWMEQYLGKLGKTGSTTITLNLHFGGFHRPVEGVCCEIKQLPLKRRL